MNDMMYMQSWRPATLPSLVALATTVTCQNACRLNGAWSAITASSTYTFQMYDNTVSYAKPSPQDLNMQNAEIWSAERVETPLRTRGWHQRAVPWRRSRGSPAAQWFHWGCWTDCGGVVGGGGQTQSTETHSWLTSPHMITDRPFLPGHIFNDAYSMSGDRMIRSSMFVCDSCISSKGGVWPGEHP